MGFQGKSIPWDRNSDTNFGAVGVNQKITIEEQRILNIYSQY